MRRSLSFVLVVLLLLRGLVGDAMAMGMAPVSVPATPLHQQTAVLVEGGSNAHSQDRAVAGVHGAAVDTNAAPSSCPAEGTQGAFNCGHASGPACSACGLCHSALPAVALSAQPQALELGALQPAGHTPFASAAAALATKPPIS